MIEIIYISFHVFYIWVSVSLADVFVFVMP